MESNNMGKRVCLTDRKGLSVRVTNQVVDGDAGASTSSAAFATPLTEDEEFKATRLRNIKKREEMLRSIASAVSVNNAATPVISFGRVAEDVDVAPAPAPQTIWDEWKQALLAMIQKPRTEYQKLKRAQSKQQSKGSTCQYGRPDCDRVLGDQYGLVSDSFDYKHQNVYVCGPCFMFWRRHDKSWEDCLKPLEPSAKQKAMGSTCQYGRPDCDRVLDDQCVLVSDSFDSKHQNVYVCGPCFLFWWRHDKSWEGWKPFEPSARQKAIGSTCQYGRPDCDRVLGDKCRIVSDSFDSKHQNVYVCQACFMFWRRHDKSWED